MKLYCVYCIAKYRILINLLVLFQIYRQTFESDTYRLTVKSLTYKVFDFSRIQTFVLQNSVFFLQAFQNTPHEENFKTIEANFIQSKLALVRQRHSKKSNFWRLDMRQRMLLIFVMLQKSVC